MTSQLPSARTPPHGPITMCFGQELAVRSFCIAPGFHAGTGGPRGEWGRWGGCEDVTSGRVGVCGDRGLLHLGWPRR